MVFNTAAQRNTFQVNLFLVWHGIIINPYIINPCITRVTVNPYRKP